jgi:type I restriction enzyme, S subunit
VSEEDLPEGWVECTMGDIADVVGGGTPKASDPANFAARGHPWITPADLSGYRDVYIRRGSRDLSDEGLRTSSAKLVPTGTVLMSSRAPIGYLAVASNPIATNQGFRSFICKPGIHPEFVYYWLMYSRDLIEEMGSGSTFTEVSGSRCKEIPFRFPPFSEQKRIAAKVEELLARVNAARERLARVPAVLKRFRQAVLAAACDGRLTEDWRLTTGNTREWRSAALPEIGDARLGKMLDKAKNVGRAKPYLRNINVRWFGFDLSNVQQLKVTDREIEELTVRLEDVLICEGGEPGRCAVWRGPTDAYVYQKALHRVRVKNGLLPDWLCYSVKDAADSGRLSGLFTGSTIKHLTGVALDHFELELPPIEEQREIVCRVEALFKVAGAIEGRVAAATARAEKLTQAILAKAFRGELVPTEAELARRAGRTYEPASAPLERIRAESAMADTKADRSPRRPEELLDGESPGLGEEDLYGLSVARRGRRTASERSGSVDREEMVRLSSGEPDRKGRLSTPLFAGHRHHRRRKRATCHR